MALNEPLSVQAHEWVWISSRQRCARSSQLLVTRGGPNQIISSTACRMVRVNPLFPSECSSLELDAGANSKWQPALPGQMPSLEICFVSLVILPSAFLVVDVAVFRCFLSFIDPIPLIILLNVR